MSIQQVISFKTIRTYSYRPIKSLSSEQGQQKRSGVASGKVTKSKAGRAPRRSNRNIAWPSKMCHSSIEPASSSAAAKPASALEGYLVLLERQRDECASRCSSVASSYPDSSREGTPA